MCGVLELEAIAAVVGIPRPGFPIAKQEHNGCTPSELGRLDVVSRRGSWNMEIRSRCWSWVHSHTQPVEMYFNGQVGDFPLLGQARHVVGVAGCSQLLGKGCDFLLVQGGAVTDVIR